MNIRHLLKFLKSTILNIDRLLREAEQLRVNSPPAKRRRFPCYDKRNIFASLHEAEFKKKFGFSRSNVICLNALFYEDFVTPKSNTTVSAVSTIDKLIITLEYLRTNSFHSSIATQGHILRNDGTIGRIINKTCRSIAPPIINETMRQKLIRLRFSNPE